MDLECYYYSKKLVHVKFESCQKIQKSRKNVLKFAKLRYLLNNISLRYNKGGEYRKWYGNIDCGDKWHDAFFSVNRGISNA